ncbi:MAG: AbrB family transcriptional regulator [Salinarimonas sp.]|nr:AbrB family transcriptional regulator [Salinarimonas sp.]
MSAGQLVSALVFGGLFHAVGIPAGWLSGAVVGVIAWGAILPAGLAARARVPKPLVDGAMILAGVVMGAGITPEALEAIGAYPFSLFALTLAVVAVTLACAAFLMRVYGWSRDDAILASLPGALTAVLAVSIDRKADVGRIAIVQSFRLLVLMAILPFLVSLTTDGDPRALVGSGQAIATPGAFALMLAAALVVGLLFERLRVAAPLLLGATLASAFLHVTEIAPGVVPPEIATAAFVVIGAFIGERFTTLDRGGFVPLFGAALGVFVIGLVVSAAFALLTAVVAGVGTGEALVAFAPGGLEAMVVLALVLGVDPLYVGVHHTIRFLGIGFALPILFRSNQSP